MILEELETYFDYVYEMVSREINLYDHDAELYILSLIFIKRIIDTQQIYTNNALAYQKWKEIRNMPAHPYYRNDDKLKNDLNVIFHMVLDDYDIIRELDFNKWNNVSNLALIIGYLDNIDFSENNISTHDFGIAYEKLIKKLFSKKKDDFISNDEITKLAVKILNVEPNERVYDPYIGIGGFITDINRDLLSNNKIVYFGKEINHNILVICKMNLIMNGIYNINLCFGDATLEPEDTIVYAYGSKFDKVITELPTTTSRNYHREITNNRFDCIELPRNSGYINIIHIIESMNEKGIAVIILPTKLLYSKGKEKRIRKYIIEDDLVECIISVPDEIRKKNKVEECIVILNKSKPDYKRNRVMIIDMTNKFKKIDNLDIYKAIDVYRAFQEQEGYSRIIELDEIKKNKYDLNYKKYSQLFLENDALLREGKGKRIKDIIYDNNRIYILSDYYSKGKLCVKSKNLNKNIIEQKLITNNLEMKAIDRSYEIINEKSMLISLIGDNLKPTIVDSNKLEGRDLIIDGNILQLKPKEDIIDFEYLYYQLYSPRVVQQLEALRTGIIHRISKNEFLDIVISVPSIELQKEYVKEQKLVLIEMERVKYEEKGKTLEIEDSISNAEETVISILAHNTLPYIMTMQFDMETIKKVLEKNNLMDIIFEPNKIIEVDDDFGEMHLESVVNPNAEKIKDVIVRIENIMKTFENIISETKKTVQLKLNKNDFELVNLRELFEEIRREKANECISKYEIDIACKDVYVTLHRASIKELFMQLIRNAEMHAFDYQNRKKKNKIEFKVVEKQDKIMIIYTNNGKTFKVTKEEYIQMGKKGQKSNGNGLGGAYVNKVIKAHKGKFEIIKTDIGMKIEITLNK